MGGLNLIKKRGPLLGGSFCAWMGLFGTFQCVMLYLRGKDTHINQTIAGGLTGATINIRGGWRYALRGGVSGAVFIGIFNIMEIFMMKNQYKMMLQNKKLQDEYSIYRELENAKKVQPNVVTMSMEEITYERKRLERELSAAMGVDVSMMG